MTTLFDRISGQNLPRGVQQEPEETRIPLHIFSALIHEHFAGNVTGAQLVNLLNLDEGQTADGVWLKQAILAAPDKSLFMRVFKNLLYLAEYSLTWQQVDETWFYNRLIAEVENQGGPTLEK